jgi:hypothetical protein
VRGAARRRHGGVLVAAAIVAGWMLVACSGGSAPHAAATSTTSTTINRALGSGGTSSTSPPVTGPDLASSSAAVADGVIKVQHLDAASAACVRVRLAADAALAARGVAGATAVGVGCARMADQIAPTFVGTLQASRHLTAAQAACVTEALYRLSSAQMDAVTSAMLDPAGRRAARARSVVTAGLKRCGVG